MNRGSNNASSRNSSRNSRKNNATTASGNSSGNSSGKSKNNNATTASGKSKNNNDTTATGNSNKPRRRTSSIWFPRKSSKPASANDANNLADADNIKYIKGSNHLKASSSYPGSIQRLLAQQSVNSAAQTKAAQEYVSVKAEEIIDNMNPKLKSILQDMKTDTDLERYAHLIIKDIVTKKSKKDIHIVPYINTLTTKIMVKI